MPRLAPIALTLFFALPSPAIAQGDPAAALAAFLTTEFDLVASTVGFPIGVGPGAGVMADPGQPFNATDVIRAGLPHQRLVFGGRSDTLSFVYYEQGGFAYGRHLVLFDEGPGAPRTRAAFQLVAPVDVYPADLPSLRAHVAEAEVVLSPSTWTRQQQALGMRSVYDARPRPLFVGEAAAFPARFYGCSH